MKRKTMTLVLCLLAALALVSVGFASWVITANEGDTIQGNIKVDEVLDKRISAKATFAGDKNSFVFGAEENAQSIENAWLTNNNSDDANFENLEVTVNVTVTKGKNIEWSQVKVTGILAENAGTSFLGDYIALNVSEPTFTTTDTSTGDTRVYSATFSVKWGEHFGNENPYKFYNTGHKAEDKIDESETTYADDALTALTALKELEKDNAFKITITVSVE